MREVFEAPRSSLVELLSTTARGPKRNGVFALLLLLQTCCIMLEPYPIQPKNHRKQLLALKKRLSSLSLPAQLRRAIPSAIEELSSFSAGSVSLVLQQLAAPSREAIGAQCGDMLEAVARETRSVGSGPGRTG